MLLSAAYAHSRCDSLTLPDFDLRKIIFVGTAIKQQYPLYFVLSL